MDAINTLILLEADKDIHDKIKLALETYVELLNEGWSQTYSVTVATKRLNKYDRIIFKNSETFKKCSYIKSQEYYDKRRFIHS